MKNLSQNFTYVIKGSKHIRVLFGKYNITQTKPEINTGKRQERSEAVYLQELTGNVP